MYVSQHTSGLKPGSLMVLLIQPSAPGMNTGGGGTVLLAIENHSGYEAV